MKENLRPKERLSSSCLYSLLSIFHNRKKNTLREPLITTVEKEIKYYFYLEYYLRKN